jgi:hypothetical protein
MSDNSSESPGCFDALGSLVGNIYAIVIVVSLAWWAFVNVFQYNILAALAVVLALLIGPRILRNLWQQREAIQQAFVGLIGLVLGICALGTIALWLGGPGLFSWIPSDYVTLMSTLGVIGIGIFILQVFSALFERKAQ